MMAVVHIYHICNRDWSRSCLNWKLSLTDTTMPAVITTGATIVGAGFTGCSSGIFKVWCLGNNVYEKYAFTFIQHSRSTFWLISTEAYNPEASKYHLLLRRFHGNDPSYKMGRVSFCSGTNRPLVPSVRAQDIRVCCVKWVSVPNQSTGHMAAWDTESKGICVRSY